MAKRTAPEAPSLATKACEFAQPACLACRCSSAFRDERFQDRGLRPPHIVARRIRESPCGETRTSTSLSGPKSSRSTEPKKQSSVTLQRVQKSASLPASGAIRGFVARVPSRRFPMPQYSSGGPRLANRRSGSSRNPAAYRTCIRRITRYRHGFDLRLERQHRRRAGEFNVAGASGTRVIDFSSHGH